MRRARAPAGRPQLREQQGRARGATPPRLTSPERLGTRGPPSSSPGVPFWSQRWWWREVPGNYKSRHAGNIPPLLPGNVLCPALQEAPARSQPGSRPVCERASGRCSCHRRSTRAAAPRGSGRALGALASGCPAAAQVGACLRLGSRVLGRWG